MILNEKVLDGLFYDYQNDQFTVKSIELLLLMNSISTFRSEEFLELE